MRDYTHEGEKARLKKKYYRKQMDKRKADLSKYKKQYKEEKNRKFYEVSFDNSEDE